MRFSGHPSLSRVFDRRDRSVRSLDVGVTVEFDVRSSVPETFDLQFGEGDQVSYRIVE